MFAGLFRKYALVLIVLVGGLFGISGAVEFAFNYRESLAASAFVQQAHARSAAARIENFLATVSAQVGESADLPWASRLLDAQDRREEYHRLMKISPAITEIRHLDKAGRESLRVSRLHADRLQSQQDASRHPQFIKARTERIAFGETFFREGAEPYLTLAIRDREEGSGVTLAEINLKFVGDIVERIRVGREGRVYVIDGTNHLVAHPNLSLVLRRTDLSGYPPLSALRESGGTQARMLEAEGLEGGAMMVSAALIPAAGWLVVVEQPRAEVFEPVYATLWRTVILFVVGLLAAIAASFFLARRLSGPILEVRRGAGRIARGELAARINVKTGDEVEALASEFNFMAGQLQDYTTGLERKVSEKTAQLELANRHKSEFLANMSHELRTPLNAVIGFSEALDEEMFGALNAKQKEYVRDINASGQHLLSLINDILDLAKVEAGRMVVDLQEFDVGMALANARTLIRERAHSRGLRLEFAVDDGLGTWVADERKFKQVVVNLLSNAVKFTPPGGLITLAAQRSPEALLVRVSDTGPGIAPADQDTIFHEFRQLTASGEARHEGTGLGLSLSKRLVELHGGTIAVQSAPGEGATFTVCFPKATVQAAHG